MEIYSVPHNLKEAEEYLHEHEIEVVEYNERCFKEALNNGQQHSIFRKCILHYVDEPYKICDSPMCYYEKNSKDETEKYIVDKLVSVLGSKGYKFTYVLDEDGHSYLNMFCESSDLKHYRRKDTLDKHKKLIIIPVMIFFTILCLYLIFRYVLFTNKKDYMDWWLKLWKGKEIKNILKLKNSHYFFWYPWQ